ncbi:MAG: anaerobic ribonucleoside-triphosphate reductase [Coprococcus sp.]
MTRSAGLAHRLRSACSRTIYIDAPFNLQYYRPGDYNTGVACRLPYKVYAGNVYDPTEEVTCGRGNLSFTSINLPRLGIEAHGDD